VERYADYLGALRCSLPHCDGILATTQNLGTLPIDRLQIGDSQKSRTYDVAFDDAAFSTIKV